VTLRVCILEQFSSFLTKGIDTVEYARMTQETVPPGMQSLVSWASLTSQLTAIKRQNNHFQLFSFSTLLSSNGL
jgi:hypothetical protein